MGFSLYFFFRLPECSRKLETRINLRFDLMAKGCRENESREGEGEGGRGGGGGEGVGGVT